MIGRSIPLIQISNSAAQTLFAANPNARAQSDAPSKGEGFAAFLSTPPESNANATNSAGSSALTNLQKRLGDLKSMIEAALQEDGSVALSSKTLQSIVHELGTILSEFEAATGLGLTDALQAFYEPTPGFTEALAENLDPAQSAQALPALLSLLDLAKTVSGQLAQVSRPSSGNVSPTDPLPTIPLARTAQDATSFRPQIETAASALQGTTLAKAGLGNLQVVSETADENTDLPAALTLALAAADASGNSTGDMQQKAFDFAAAVASNHLTQISNTFGFAAFEPALLGDAIAQDGLSLATTATETTSASTKPDAPNSSSPSKFATVIADQLRQAQVQDGVTKIELSPRGLGTIEIEVMTDADGLTSVLIKADSPAVLNALRELRDSVAPLINMDSGGTLSFEERSPDNGTGSDQDQNGFSNAESDVSDVDQALTTAQRAADILDGRQLDITT